MVFSREPLDKGVESALQTKGWHPVYASTLEEALSGSQERGFSLGIAVFALPSEQGWVDECRAAIERLRGTMWIGILGPEQITEPDIARLAVDALRDFVLVPLDPLRLTVVLDQASAMAEVEQALGHGPRQNAADYLGFVGESPAMQDVYKRIQRAAAADFPILITGDTGTGKELVARAIHARSRRASGPFVALNCAAIPRDLLLSELFGHEKGAFTGASQNTIGRVEAANGGTLLLDEIGAMPPESQASLLRVVEEKRVTPVGSSSSSHVDVRFLATTNRDLEAEIVSHRFRADLYYRLASMTIRLPTLNERPGDVEALAYHFLEQARQKARRRILGFGDGVLEALRRHTWTGNVRELRNCIVQGAATCSGRLIKLSDLRLGTALARRRVPESLQHAVHEAEREALLSALTENHWNVSQSARDLKISRMTMYRLMDKHGISKKDDAPTRVPGARAPCP